MLLFSKQEMKLLKDEYFVVIRREDRFVEVMSKNTQHCWMVFKKRSKVDRPVCLYHKHTRDTQWYHLHWETKTVAGAVKDIKDHDSYVLMHPDYLAKRKRG